MWRLHQFPLCPFSRKVRLQLSEKGVAYELVRTNPWDAGDEFWSLNPPGRVPVLEASDKPLVIADSRAICEYIEETVESTPLLSGTGATRAETRRLVALFDEELFGDVTGPLLHERMKKRLVLRQPPDSRVLREVMKLAEMHLNYIDWLVDNRPWLAGRADEPGRSRRRGADLGRRLSRRDRLARARADAPVVRRVQEPPVLSPAPRRADGADPAPVALRRPRRLSAPFRTPISPPKEPK